MAINRTYLAVIAVVIVIAVSAGGYMYYQRMQAGAMKEERYQRWVKWSRTLYMGGTSGGTHPGINIGRGNDNHIHGNARAAKLIYIDPDDADIFHPCAAESWEFKYNSAGEGLIEYKIRPGLKFPDGTDVTSYTIKTNWEREVYEMPNREAHRVTSHYQWHINSWKRLETPDELTFQQILPDLAPKFLPYPLAALHSLNQAFVISPTSTEKYGLETNDIMDFVNQVGWGPFLMKDFVTDERYTLVPWDDFPENPLGGYKGPTKVTKLDEVIFTTYGDQVSMRMALEAGEIDFATRSLLRSDLPDLMENPNIVVDYALMLGSTNFLHLNYRPEFAPLNDWNVRRAIHLAIFPEEIIEKVMFGTAEIAHSPVRPFQPYFIPAFEELRSAPAEDRIATAKELLVEAGYPNGFSTELWISEGAEETRMMSTIIQSQLKKIGIDVGIKSFESGVYRELDSSGQCPMFFRGWSFDFNDPDSELFYLLYSTHDRAAMRYGYNNSYMDELINRGKALYDPEGPSEERREIYEEIQRMIVDDAICVPLYYDSYWEAHRDYVKDFKMWKTTYCNARGIWNIGKEIPEDWETREPPH